MRHVGSSAQGVQHSAAVQPPGTRQGTSAVEIIAPALPVSGQLNPRHGYVGWSVRQERGVDVAGQEVWQAW